MSCNIRGIHPFRSRYKTWGSPQQVGSNCRTSLELCSVFWVFLIEQKMHRVTGTSELELFQGHIQKSHERESLPFVLCDPWVIVYSLSRPWPRLQPFSFLPQRGAKFVLRSLSIVSAGRDSGIRTITRSTSPPSRDILLTCGGGFPIEEGPVGCPIQPSSLMALLHHERLPVHRLFCSSSGFCSSCFLQEHPRSRFLVTSKSARLPGLSLVYYYYYAAFLPVL